MPNFPSNSKVFLFFFFLFFFPVAFYLNEQKRQLIFTSSISLLACLWTTAQGMN